VGPSSKDEWDELTHFISKFFVDRDMSAKESEDEDEDMLGKSGMNWKELN